LLGSLGSGLNVVVLQLMLVALLMVQMTYGFYIWFSQDLTVDGEI